jgi:hypothetical protein
METIIDVEESTKFSPQFAKRGGLLPVAVQDTSSGRILMLASVNHRYRYGDFLEYIAQPSLDNETSGTT